ncbi:MAG: cytochrome c oxidase assembly protein [Gemmatimonadaceae bacterium]|nr:cytochrome c oxidase assembly protein [Gemmatimonadaceae bacterium]
MAAPLYALLHANAQLSWTSFTVHWSTVIGILALAGLYEWSARIAVADRSLGAPPTPAQRARFVAGLAAIFLSLNGPLHDLSDSFLFSAHMVQHLVLTLVVPPLLLSGTPASLFRQALRSRAVARVARVVTKPIFCFAIFNVVLTAWHFPVAYNLAVANHPVHIVQHLMFMIAATLMWWPLLSPLPELPRLSYPLQLLYCFLMTIPMSLVAVSITYSQGMLYPAYASAPRLWGISPMQDQLLGGLIMWIPGGLFFVAVMAVIFFKWAAANSDSVEGAQLAPR